MSSSNSNKNDQGRKDRKVLFEKLTDFERLPNLAPLEVDDEKEELFVDAQCSFWVHLITRFFFIILIFSTVAMPFYNLVSFLFRGY